MPTHEAEQDAASSAQECSPARELSELLEIIVGTTHQLENIWDGDHGSEKYLTMLRVSVERAASITAQLLAHAGVKAPAASFLTQPAPPAAISSSAKRPRLLVVDDEPTALAAFQEFLAIPGYEIVTAQSGFECLDKISRRQFDLVVLDYAMPFMDGGETFHRIQSIRPGLPVLLCTGFIERDKLNDLHAHGLSAFLRKPLAPSELLDCVARLLGEDRPSAQASECRGIAAAL